MFVSMLFLLEVSLLVSCISTKCVADSENSSEVEAIEKWMRINQNVRDFVESSIDKTLPTLMRTISSLNMTVQCRKETRHLMRGLRELQPWAVKFIDSSAKGIDGLLNGIVTSFGVYDECLDIVVPSKRNVSNELFQGQYCSLDIKPPLLTEHEVGEKIKYMPDFVNANATYHLLPRQPKHIQHCPFRIGICVPSGCTKEDVDKAAKFIAEISLLKCGVVRCEVKEETKYSFLEICVICFFLTLGFLAVIGSLLDVHLKFKNISAGSKIHSMLLSFSVFENTASLFEVEKEKKELSCFSGIRFITMTLIIYAHTYLYLNKRTITNRLDLWKFDKSFAYQVISNADYNVDTFFLMSGFLVCYCMFIQEKHFNRPFSFTGSVIHRLFRIFPSYMSLILGTFVFEKMGSGPMWHEYLEMTQTTGKNCYKNWWRNLLFTGNFLRDDQKCLAYTWYMDAEFQLYLLALFITFVLLRRPIMGIGLAIAIIITSIISVGIFYHIYQLKPVITFEEYFTEKSSISRRIFFTPVTHIGPYCTGILIGYFYVTEPDIKITKKKQVIGWILALACNFSLMFGTIYWRNCTLSTTFATTVYSSIKRTAWALGTSWVILCCSSGHGGFVNSFLSNKAFIALSRLTFTAYLLHPVIQVMHIARQRTLINASHFNTGFLFFASCVATYIAAFVATIIIEKPFMNLGNIVLANLNKTSKNNKSKSFNTKEVAKDVKNLKIS